MAANPVVSLPPLKLATTTTVAETTIICTGKITSDTSDILSDEVRRLIPQSRHIIIDLNNVSYVDSSGLGALVGMYVSARRAHVGMKLVKLNDRIAELLRLTKLATVFEGYGEYL